MLRHVRARRASGDEGISLAELLVAIAILGICVVFLLGGTTALPVATTVHRRDAQADTILRNWAEAIKAAPFPSTGLCSTVNSNPYSIVSLGGSLPQSLADAGFTASPPLVNTWDGVTPPAFHGCNAGTAKLARVGLTVTTIDTVHPVSQSLEVVVAST